MKKPDFHERLAAVEDEIRGLDSMIDSRTRTLWAEIQKLQGQVKTLLEMKYPHASAASARREE